MKSIFLCLSLGVATFLSGSALGQEVWKVLYKCRKGQDQVSLLHHGQKFRLSGLSCLDPDCYLVDRYYDSYILFEVEEGFYKGDQITLVEDGTAGTVEIKITSGSLSSGRYVNCK